MGSVKKKISKVFNKVADKIIPKEIAPILPIAAAFVPGLGLAGTGVFNNWILPQLMTGLGTAKRTGKINPLAQAMTALASYSAGPGQELSGEQKAFLDSDAGAPFLERTAGSGITSPELGVNIADLDAAKSITGSMPVKRPDFMNQLSIFKDPEAAKAFKAFEYQPSSIMEQTGNFLRPMTQRIGGALKDPFGSWGNAMTAASVAGAPSLINEAVLSADRAKAEEAARVASAKQAMTDYQGAIHNLTGLYGQMGTDPAMTDYFNPWEWYTAKDGGRVGYNMGELVTGAQEFQNEIRPMKKPSILERLGIPSILEEMYGTSDVDKIIEQQKIIEEYMKNQNNKGGRIKYAGGDMVGGLGAMHPMNPAPSTVAPGMPQGMQVDGRNGSFIPMGAQEKKDDVPAMLAKNEFVMTSDAVKGMGNGDVNAGAQKMYDLMNQLEANV